MIKEEKNIDFYTTGRQPSDQEFNRISKWIKNNKRKKITLKSTIKLRKEKRNVTEQKTSNS